MRTILLEPWQIVGLTLLTLILAVILSRVAILIVMVLSRHWFEQNQNPPELSAGTTLSDYRRSNESGEFTTSLVDGIGRPISESEETPEGQRTTGITPGGVGFVMTAHAGGALIPKGRLGFRERRKKGQQ